MVSDAASASRTPVSNAKVTHEPRAATGHENRSPRRGRPRLAPVVVKSSQASTKPARSGSAAVDRILEGWLPAEVLRFGVPLALGMGLQTTFNLVDTYIVAQIGGESGAAAMSAIAPCDNIAAVGTILSYGLSIATGTLISHKHAQGDEAGVRRVAWQSLLLLTFISAAFAVIGLFGSGWLLEDVMRTKGMAAEVGIPYLTVTMTGSCSIFLLLHLITIQRALGSSKTPISMLVFANAANLLFAVLFVFGPGPAPPIFSWGPPIADFFGVPRMEMVGAAWATVLARLLALLPAFVVVYHRHQLFQADSRERPNGKVMRRIWDIGWPTSSQLVVRILAVVAVIAFANAGYTTEEDQSIGAAMTVVLRWEAMALFVGLGWGSASQTFVGQNLGAGNRLRAQHSGWYMAAYNSLMMLAFAVTCMFFGRELIEIFTDDPKVVEAALDYFVWVAPSYVGLGLGIVLGSAIQGAGASRQTFLIDLGVIVLFQIPLCVLVVHVFQAPVSALWQVVALTYCTFAVVYFFFYKRGSFLRTQIT